jgi:surfactin synthase thioesterase subunit
MTGAWLLRPAARPQAGARLFCFPYAGVGGSVYRLWPAGLPVELEVCAVQLPGRENRLRETAVDSIPALVDLLVPALLPHLDRPFAVFGHSMGAVLASEFVRALASGGGPLPRHLIVSGRRPPHMPGPESPLHGLPDAEFVAEINRRYGGIPVAVMEHADLVELLLPSLRADMTAIETHRPKPRPPLPCPISVFAGSHDRLTPRDHLEAWRGETLNTFRVRVFPGDHFYLNVRRDDVLADLSVTLAPMIGAARFGEAKA